MSAKVPRAAVGPKKPPRLPMEFIQAMPEAAAVPVRNVESIAMRLFFRDIRRENLSEAISVDADRVIRCRGLLVEFPDLITPTIPPSRASRAKSSRRGPGQNRSILTIADATAHLRLR